MATNSYFSIAVNYGTKKTPQTSVHQRQKFTECSDCLKTLSSGHCGIEYSCTTAKRSKILVNHERQHTGAKPYECEVSGMQFTCWSNYNKHMKRRYNTDTARKKITAQGVFPVDPITGQVVQPVISGLEEWKEQIMLPVKRGKKPAIKTETTFP